MYSIDVNILVYASDQGSTFHDRAAGFVAGLARHPDLLCLTWPTIMGYLRITTHPSIFAEPLTPAVARSNIAQLLALPRARVLSEGDDFWAIYLEVVGDQVVRGNLVPDAHVAALLKQHGVTTLYSADADFRRFPFLEVRSPL